MVLIVSRDVNFFATTAEMAKAMYLEQYLDSKFAVCLNQPLLALKLEHA